MIQPGDHIADQTLSAAIDEQLTLEEARQANAHFETCSACRVRLDELRSVVGLLRALPTLEVPRDFSIGPRLVADPPNVVRLRRWYGVARAGAASLAAAFVFLSAGALYVDSRSGTSTGALSAQAVQSVPPPEVARPQGQQDAAAPTAPAPAAAVAPPPAAAQAAPAALPATSQAAPAAPPAAAQPAPAAGAPAAGQPAPAAAAKPAAPAAALAAPAAAPSAQTAPGAAVAARSVAAPSTTGAEVPADQVTAATSVRPLPTLAPTLAPIPTRAPPQVAQPAIAATRIDSASPLRIAAAGVGVLALIGSIATLVIRRRLRAVAKSPTEYFT